MIISVRPENLVRLGVADVELQRLRQRLDRLADLLLREQAVAERIPAPRRRRALLDVGGRAAARPPRTCRRGCSPRAAPRTRRRRRGRRFWTRGAGRASAPSVTASVRRGSAGFSSAALRYAATARGVALGFERRPRRRCASAASGAAGRRAERPSPVVLAARHAARPRRGRARCSDRDPRRTSSRPFASAAAASSLRPARDSASPS